jgi:ribbon-helix-helix CopG family protein
MVNQEDETSPTKRGRAESPKRVNVAVTPETVRAIEHVIEREGVSLTEAVRRLIGYGEFVYKTIKDEGAELQVRSNDSVREVVLL